MHDADRICELKKPGSGLVCIRGSEDASLCAPYDNHLANKTKNLVSSAKMCYLVVTDVANNHGGTSDSRCELVW
jgi:hypothetical protein